MFYGKQNRKITVYAPYNPVVLTSFLSDIRHLNYCISDTYNLLQQDILECMLLYILVFIGYFDAHYSLPTN